MHAPTSTSRKVYSFIVRPAKNFKELPFVPPFLLHPWSFALIYGMDSFSSTIWNTKFPKSSDVSLLRLTWTTPSVSKPSVTPKTTLLTSVPSPVFFPSIIVSPTRLCPSPCRCPTGSEVKAGYGQTKIYYHPSPSSTPSLLLPLTFLSQLYLQPKERVIKVPPSLSQ